MSKAEQQSKNYFMGMFVVLFIVMGIGFIYSADYHDSIPVTTDSGGNIVINPHECQEDWSGSTWSQCLEDNTQTFICFDKNNCGTENLKPAQCGEVRSCNVEEPAPSSGGSSGGGGGGGSSGGGGGAITTTSTTNQENSSTCVEKWQCEIWSNEENSCGTRSCTDLNSCGTEELKPLTSKSCSSGFFSSLFSFLTGRSVAGTNSSAYEGSTSFLGPILLAIILLGVIGIVAYKKQGKSTKKK